MGVAVDQTNAPPSDRRRVWIRQKQKSRSFDFSWRSGMWSPVDDRRKVLVVPLPAAPKPGAYRARLRPPPSMFQMDSGSSYESYDVADVRPSSDKPALQRSKATAAEDGLKPPPPPPCDGTAERPGEVESGRKAWIRQERRSHSLDSSLEESTSSSKGDGQFPPPATTTPGRRCGETDRISSSPTVKDKRLRLQQQRKSRSLDDNEQQQQSWIDDAVVRRPEEIDYNLSSRNPMLSTTAYRKHFVRLQDADPIQSRPSRRQLTVETLSIGFQRQKVVPREGLSPTQRGPTAVTGMKELSHRDKRAAFSDQKSFSCEVPSQQMKTDTACHRKQSEPTVAASSLQAPKSRGRLLPQLPMQGPELEKHINQVCCYNELVDLLQTQPSATGVAASTHPSQPPEIRISYGQYDSPQMSPGLADSSTRNKRRCFAGQKSFSYEVNQYSKVVQDGPVSSSSATSVSQRKHGSAPIVYQPVVKINRMRDYFDENEIEEFEIEPATTLRSGATDLAPYTATVEATRVCTVPTVTTGAAARRLGFSNQRSLSCEQASLQPSRERRLSPEVKGLAAFALSCRSQKCLVPEVTEDYKSYGAKRSPTREMSPRSQRLRDVRREDNLQPQQKRFSEDVQTLQKSVKLELRTRQSSPAIDSRSDTPDTRIPSHRLGKEEQVERMKDKNERSAKDETIERLKSSQAKPARQEAPDRSKAALEKSFKEVSQPKFKAMIEKHSGRNSTTCTSGLRLERKSIAVDSRQGSDPQKATSMRQQTGAKKLESVQTKVRDQKLAGRTQILEMSRQEVQTTGDRLTRKISPNKDTSQWKAKALEEDETSNLHAARDRFIQKENARNGCHADRDEVCQVEQDKRDSQAEKDRASHAERNAAAQERKASRTAAVRPHFVEVSHRAESSDRTRRNEEKHVYVPEYGDEFGELVSDGVVTWRRKSPEKRLVRGPDGRNALAGAVHLAKCHSIAEPGTCLSWLTTTAERTTPHRVDRREMFAQQKSVSCDTGADDAKDTEVLYLRQHQQASRQGHSGSTFAGMSVREKRLAMLESKKSYSVDELVHMQQLLNEGLIQPENLPEDLFIYQETLARRCQQDRGTTNPRGRGESVHTTPQRGVSVGQTRQKLLLLHSMKALHDHDDHGLEHPNAAADIKDCPEGSVTTDSYPDCNRPGSSAGKSDQFDGQLDRPTPGNELEHPKGIASGRARKDFGSKLPLIRFLGKLMLDKKRNSRTGQK